MWGVGVLGFSGGVGLRGLQGLLVAPARAIRFSFPPKYGCHHEGVRLRIHNKGLVWGIVGLGGLGVCLWVGGRRKTQRISEFVDVYGFRNYLQAHQPKE